MNYSPLASTRATTSRLGELGLHTKKSLGQHFLIDDNVVGRILELAQLEATETILEIGPGIGTLTLALESRVKRVVAIEYDTNLIAPLQEIADPQRVTIVEGDAAKLLRTPPTEAQTASKLVANLPYEVAATVVLRAFENLPHLSSATVMVQKEVAQRMRAAISTKDYSAYSVKLGLLAVPTDSFDVARTSFLPPPRVDSTVIRLDRRDDALDRSTYQQVARVIDTAFGMRRKTLRNNLRRGFADDAINNALALSGIDGAVRAETLTREQFIALAHTLSS